MSDIPLIPIGDLDNLDLTGVDTRRPLIKGGSVLELVVKKFEKKRNKKNTGDNLNITLALSTPAETVDGAGVQQGFELYDLISLVPTPDYDPRQKLAIFKEAVLGHHEGAFNISELLNRTVVARVDVEEEDAKEGYPAKNKIGKYFKPRT
jgi:hypothetical protein